MTILDTTDLDTNADTNKDYLAELVGEGKKYSDPNELAKGAVFKDQHITRLEREAAEMRETIKTLSATKRMEELLDQMKALRDAPPAPSNVDNQDREPTSKSVGLTPEDVTKIVEQREDEGRRKANSATVRNRLVQEFGADYVQKVKEQAAKLGLPVEYLDQTAQNSPNAFYQLMGISPQPRLPENDNPHAPPRSTTTKNFSPNSQEKNWAYYENMRKTDPARYHTISVQNEMERQAQKFAREGRDFGIPL